MKKCKLTIPKLPALHLMFDVFFIEITFLLSFYTLGIKSVVFLYIRLISCVHYDCLLHLMMLNECLLHDGV